MRVRACVVTLWRLCDTMSGSDPNRAPTLDCSIIGRIGAGTVIELMLKSGLGAGPVPQGGVDDRPKVDQPPKQDEPQHCCQHELNQCHQHPSLHKLAEAGDEEAADRSEDVSG